MRLTRIGGPAEPAAAPGGLRVTRPKAHGTDDPPAPVPVRALAEAAETGQEVPAIGGAGGSGTKPKRRLPYWDNVKGILIFLVAFGHCLYDAPWSPVTGTVVSVIYTFHMPAFVFVSGFFGKSGHSRSESSIARLVVGYAIFDFLALLKEYSRGGPAVLSVPYVSMWFMISIVIWRVVTPHVAKRWADVALLFAVGVLVGLFSDVGNGLALARTIALLPFYAAGYLMSGDRMDRLTGRSSGTRVAHEICGAAALALALALAAYMSHCLGYERADLTYGAYASLPRMSVRVTIYASAILCTIALLLLVPDRRIPLVTTWGRNSLSIYLMHIIPSRLVVELMAEYGGLPDDRMLEVALAFALASCLMFGNGLVGRSLNSVIGSIADAAVGTGRRRFAIWAVVIAMIASPVVAADRAGWDDPNKVLTKESIASVWHDLGEMMDTGPTWSPRHTGEARPDAAQQGQGDGSGQGA